MYYGNEAAAALPGASVGDAATVLSFDFAEPSGEPRDGTAFGTTAQSSTAQPAIPGLVDLGAALAPTSVIALPPSPALSFVPTQGFTFSAWIKPSTDTGDGLLFTQSGPTGRLEITAGANRLDAVVLENGTTTRVEAPLTPDTWQAVGVTLGERITVYVDGREAGSAAVVAPTLNGPAQLGAADDRAGFSGAIDVLRLDNTARPPGWFRLEHEMQRAESTAIGYGADESRTGGGWQKELDLILGLLRAVTIDGWIVIALIVALGLLSADVLVRKLRLLHVTEHADAAFLSGFAAQWRSDSSALASGDAPSTPDSAATGRESSILGRLYRVALSEAEALPVAAHGRQVTAESIEVIRGALDATVVAETERLQRRLVLMTIAVSGGPFLGLLGTVVGVMITFAAVAASGDVNVTTIAPGIAAALFATVMGLLVAIPSLFGYNFVATRIAARIAAMEVFADQMVGRIHAALGPRARWTPEVAHAA
jgi:biopolymer transport protein ExbB